MAAKIQHMTPKQIVAELDKYIIGQKCEIFLLGIFKFFDQGSGYNG